MNQLNQLTNAENPAQWAKNVNDTFGAEVRAEDVLPGAIRVEVYDDAPSVKLVLDAASANGLRVADINVTDSTAYTLLLKGGEF